MKVQIFSWARSLQQGNLMVVCCQKCLKRYYLDDEVLGSDGKHVRCTACNHVWHQRPLENRRNALVVLPNSTAENKKPFPYLKYACIISSIFFVFLCVLAILYNKNVFESSQIKESAFFHSFSRKVFTIV